MKTTRTYTMSARARAVEQTRTRILDAVVSLSGQRRLAVISLDDVATRAGVSVQTVLRQFGSRAGLIDAATAYVNDAVVRERRAPAGDLDDAIRTLVDHYEARGTFALLLLSQETEDPQVQTVTAEGKRLHRAWVEEMFAPLGPDEELVDLLVVATDVYTWKLLRLDRGLSRRQTEERMKTLVRALCGTELKERDR